MGELSSKTPNQTLDVLGRVCPYPLVLTKKAMEKLRVVLKEYLKTEKRVVEKG